VTKFSADVLIFESALAPNPVEAVTELLRQTPQLKIVVVTPHRTNNLLSIFFAAVRTGFYRAKLNRRCWSTACAKLPPENRGWKTRRFIG